VSDNPKLGSFVLLLYKYLRTLTHAVIYNVQVTRATAKSQQRRTDVSDPLLELSPRGSSCCSETNKLPLYRFPKAVIMIYLRYKRIYLQRLTHTNYTCQKTELEDLSLDSNIRCHASTQLHTALSPLLKLLSSEEPRLCSR
jgi:hypothetical protein